MGESGWVEKGRLIQIDALPSDMAAEGAAGTPTFVRWDFDVAAQEGDRSLYLLLTKLTLGREAKEPADLPR